jgi:hypothetical protein
MNSCLVTQGQITSVVDDLNKRGYTVVSSEIVDEKTQRIYYRSRSQLEILIASPSIGKKVRKYRYHE